MLSQKQINQVKYDYIQTLRKVKQTKVKLFKNDDYKKLKEILDNIFVKRNFIAIRCFHIHRLMSFSILWDVSSAFDISYLDKLMDSELMRISIPYNYTYKGCDLFFSPSDFTKKTKQFFLSYIEQNKHIYLVTDNINSQDGVVKTKLTKESFYPQKIDDVILLNPFEDVDSYND